MLDIGRKLNINMDFYLEIVIHYEIKKLTKNAPSVKAMFDELNE